MKLMASPRKGTQVCRKGIVMVNMVRFPGLGTVLLPAIHFFRSEFIEEDLQDANGSGHRVVAELAHTARSVFHLHSRCSSLRAFN